MASMLKAIFYPPILDYTGVQVTKKGLVWQSTTVRNSCGYEMYYEG